MKEYMFSALEPRYYDTDKIKGWRIQLQLGIHEDVVFIYSAKTGSRVIDRFIGNHNKFSAVMYLLDNGRVEINDVTAHHGGYQKTANDKTILDMNATKSKVRRIVEQMIKGTLQKDVVFIYRDPYKKYISGIYQDFNHDNRIAEGPDFLKKIREQYGRKPLDEKIGKEAIQLWKDWAKEWCDSIILGEDMMTSHSKTILHDYELFIMKSNLNMDRVCFFNMETNNLKELFEIYDDESNWLLEPDMAQLINRDRKSFSEPLVRKIIRETIETTTEYKEPIETMLKSEYKRYKWIENHDNNYNNLF